MIPGNASAELYVFIITGIVILNLFIGFIIFFVSNYRKKQQTNQQEKSLLQLHYQEGLLKARIDIQEETFNHISQEIHDNIGQQLSLAKVYLNGLATAESSDPKIGEATKLVSKAIHDLRGLSRSLNTDYLRDMGFERSIEHELDIIRGSGNYLTELTVEGDVREFDQQKALVLFRMVQEGLNNIIKHAEARHIGVALLFGDQHLTLTISDDGKGFDSASIDDSHSLGLRNMHNRARLLGGGFGLTSSPAEGTRLEIRCPI